MKAYETLERAKTALLERGWCKGIFMNDEGQVCLGGSFMRVAHLFETQRGDYGKAIKYIGEEIYPLGFKNIPHFNDSIDTSFEDVINVLDRAILKAKEDDV